MLCEKCHEREATCHSVVIIEDETQTTDLCEECFELSGSQEVKDYMRAVETAHCRYCGGQPCAGGTDFLALATGQQQTSYMCMPCSGEFHKFTKQELERTSDGLSQPEQLAAIQTLRDETDRHMKEWVSKRQSQ
jgi:protein-arginine kinase activator protein McsA